MFQHLAHKGDLIVKVMIHFVKVLFLIIQNLLSKKLKVNQTPPSILILIKMCQDCSTQNSKSQFRILEKSGSTHLEDTKLKKVKTI